MRKILLCLMLAVPLAGCSTTTPAEKFAAMETSCASYGFKPGTDAYGNCMMQKDAANAQADAASQQRFREGLHALGRSMAPRPTVTCNTFATGNRFYNTAQSTTTCQ